MKKEFDNENRNRYYGLRVGDTVCVFIGTGGAYRLAEVIEYGVMDNNAVYVRYDNGDIGSVVAELCEIITKVEDR